MNASTVYGKRAGVIQTRVPPEESEDSCLSDSGDSDDEYTPKPGDENSSNNAIILLFTYVHIFVNVTMCA